MTIDARLEDASAYPSNGSPSTLVAPLGFKRAPWAYWPILARFRPRRAALAPVAKLAFYESRQQ
jgi:hypothetical protein